MAFRESKRRDPRVPPVWIRRLRVIFVRIPERAVVPRIYCHLTVIAESNKVANLRTMSFDNRDLFARQLAQRVRGPSARIMNLRVLVRSRDVETQGDVAVPIHSDAAEPTVILIRGIGPLLIDEPRSRLAAAQFIPTDTGMTMARIPVGRYGVIEQQGLITAKVAIRQAVHHKAPSRGIDRRSFRLLDAERPAPVIPWTGIGVERFRRQTCCRDQGRR
jgi:hypothetical protein